MDDDGLARSRASRSSTASSRAAARTRSTRSAAATCTARCGFHRRGAPADRDQGILREWRIIEALDGTDVPHTRAVAACEDPSVLGRTFYLMGFVDGWSPMGIARAGRRRSTPTSKARAASPTSSSEGIALLSKVDWQAKGLAGPRAPRRLPRAPGRPLDGASSSGSSAGAPGHRRGRRPGCGRTARSTSSPGSCTATTSSPT